MMTEKVSATFLMIIVSLFLLGTRSLAVLHFRTLDTEKLHAMVVNNAYEIEAGRAKKFAIIDARTKKEYDEAHIFSSVSIPEDDFEKSKHLIPPDKATLLVVYCDDPGSDAGQRWAEKAAAVGYSNIVIYEEGFLTWKKNKMPIAPFRDM